jgi:tetratricopeptide (TPR) repeat protein
MSDPTDPQLMVARMEAEHPAVFAFVNGIVEIFYGGEAPQPGALKERVDALIKRLPGPVLLTPGSGRERAAELVEAAWETDDEAGLDLAVEALRAFPNCADAYTFLGVNAGESFEIALPMLTMAVTAGFEDLGQAMFEEHAGEFWAVEETRPFMRALAELARVNREAGALDVALAHYAELLRLNPNDDQGMRFEYLALCLQMGLDEEVEALLTAYEDDRGAAFSYGRALHAFRTEGDSQRARTLLGEAHETNPHLAEFLTGTRQLPDTVPVELQPGSPEEAALFADILGPAWEQTRHAMGWLTAQLDLGAKAAQKPPEKEKRSGPREI